MKTTGKKFVFAIYNYLISFTQTQLLLTLLALPVLVGWGLGSSIMSLVGNLIFTPVLTVFLVLSSLLLFTQLLGIPNDYLAVALNALTRVWDWALSKGSPSWIIENARPATFILIALPIIIYLVLRHRAINTPVRRVTALCLLLVGTYGIFTVQRCYNNAHTLTCRFDEKLYVIKLANQNSVVVVDDGYGARKKSPDKAINYEIKPWLIKHFGSVSIKEWRINKPSAGCFKVAQHVCSIWHVDAVWLPFFKKTLSKAGWRAFFDLRRQLEAKGVRFVRYKLKEPVRIFCEKPNSVRAPRYDA